MSRSRTRSYGGGGLSGIVLSMALALLGTGCGVDSGTGVEVGAGPEAAAPTVSAVSSAGEVRRPGPAVQGAPANPEGFPQSQPCEMYILEDHLSDTSWVPRTIPELIEHSNVVVTGEVVESHTFRYIPESHKTPFPEGQTTMYNPTLANIEPGYTVTDFVFSVERVLAINKVAEDLAGSATPKTLIIRHMGDGRQGCVRVDPAPVIGAQYLLFARITEDKPDHGDGVVAYTAGAAPVGRYFVSPSGQLVPESPRPGLPAAFYEAPIRAAVAVAGQAGLVGELQRSFRK